MYAAPICLMCFGPYIAAYGAVAGGAGFNSQLDEMEQPKTNELNINNIVSDPHNINNQLKTSVNDYANANLIFFKYLNEQIATSKDALTLTVGVKSISGDDNGYFELVTETNLFDESGKVLFNKKYQYWNEDYIPILDRDLLVPLDVKEDWLAENAKILNKEIFVGIHLTSERIVNDLFLNNEINLVSNTISTSYFDLH